MLYFIKRMKWRLIWSWAGLRETWRTEHSFRSWFWINLISSAFAVWLPLAPAERALILALGILLLGSELLNTAIERAVDYISTDQHPLAQAAKDAGSAGVAFFALSVAVAWVVVLVG